MIKHSLSPEVLNAYTKAAEEGRLAWKLGAVNEAETKFLEAWNILPNPKIEQDHAQSLAWGLVEFYRDTKQFEKAKQWLRTMKEAYGPSPNAFVNFLAGTVALDAGDLDEAFALFHELFVKFGERPFEGSDRKYLDFYKNRAGQKD